MKRLIFALVVVGFFVIPTFVTGAGTVEEVAYYSDALGMDKMALVYLPEGYENSGEEYPVVYLVGDFGSGFGNWCSIPEFVGELDLMIGDGLIDPFILVEVDQLVMPWPALPVSVPSFLVDSELNGNYETNLIEDLVPWVDATYRTMADRANRYIFGRSAGGAATTRVALRHWDVFGGVGTQVGTIAVEPLAAALPLILTDYPDGPPYDYSPTAGLWSMYLFSWCAAMTPNMTNPPWYVDIIIDEDGNLDPEVWQRFVAHSNSRWAAEMKAAGGELDIFMDAGDEDFYLPFTLYFAGVLDSLELPYTLQIFHGDHDNPPMWERLKSHTTYFMPLNATVEINPDTLKLRSRGRWVTAYLELPSGLVVSDIDLSTVAITEVDGMELAAAIVREGPTSISDVNGNGVPDLMVKFDRGDLIEQLGGHGGDTVAITLDGQLLNGWYLEAVDTVRVVD